MLSLLWMWQAAVGRNVIRTINSIFILLRALTFHLELSELLHGGFCTSPCRWKFCQMFYYVITWFIHFFQSLLTVASLFNLHLQPKFKASILWKQKVGITCSLKPSFISVSFCYFNICFKQINIYNFLWFCGLPIGYSSLV